MLKLVFLYLGILHGSRSLGCPLKDNNYKNVLPLYYPQLQSRISNDQSFLPQWQELSKYNFPFTSEKYPSYIQTNTVPPISFEDSGFYKGFSSPYQGAGPMQFNNFKTQGFINSNYYPNIWYESASYTTPVSQQWQSGPYFDGGKIVQGKNC